LTHNSSFYRRLLLSIVVALVAYPVFANAKLSLFLPKLGLIHAELVELDTFDEQGQWEQYSDPKGVELGVENSVYRASTLNAGYVWGLNKQSHSNVVLDAEATPLTIHYENGFGIMCRSDETNNGDGYYFMITGNGYYSIRIGQGNEVRPLVDWQASDAIHPELDTNHLRAVCVGNYLAFYANDELLATTTDDTYQTGFAGMAVTASANSDMDVAFDNLSIYQVTEP
jgi:hypothetical protein